uniref:PsbP C-terminal domain-containing protein n=1 Tax=Aegilops tauschii TaxID=37682 RepID=M8D257_AEGTA
MGVLAAKEVIHWRAPDHECPPEPQEVAAADGKFMPVIDRMADYSFVYPFGWQEVFVQGQDKVYKDVIEPLESVSINMIATTKEDIRDLGPPDQVAEALVRKVLSQPTQKTKLIEAKEVSLVEKGL